MRDRLTAAFQNQAIRIPDRLPRTMHQQGGSISEASPRERGVFRFLFRNGRQRSLHSIGKGTGLPWGPASVVELTTLRWIDWFNNARLHGTLGDIPPAEFEAAYYDQTVSIG